MLRSFVACRVLEKEEMGKCEWETRERERKEKEREERKKEKNERMQQKKRKERMEKEQQGKDAELLNTAAKVRLFGHFYKHHSSLS